MFYLQLALAYEDLNSGRMDKNTYEDIVVLLAEDHEQIKSVLQAPKAA